MTRFFFSIVNKTSIKNNSHSAAKCINWFPIKSHWGAQQEHSQTPLMKHEYRAHPSAYDLKSTRNISHFNLLSKTLFYHHL